VIVGEVNRASLLAPITHSRNLFLLTGLALVLVSPAISTCRIPCGWVSSCCCIALSQPGSFPSLC
jgi:hypothetical protein